MSEFKSPVPSNGRSSTKDLVGSEVPADLEGFRCLFFAFGGTLDSDCFPGFGNFTLIGGRAEEGAGVTFNGVANSGCAVSNDWCRGTPKLGEGTVDVDRPGSPDADVS